MNRLFLIISVLLFYTVSINLFCQNNKRIIGLGFSSKLFPETDIRDAQASIEAWSRELIKAKKVNFDVKPNIYDNLSKIEEAIKRNEIGMVALQAIEYFNLKSRGTIEPALIGTYNGETTEDYVLLVNKKSGIKNISQLEGKKIALQLGGKGEIARIWFESTLLKQNLPIINKFFSEVKFLNKESQVIFQVFFQQVDVCVVSNRAFKVMAELNPQIKEDLIIIMDSPKFIHNVFVFSKKLNKEDKETILSLTKDVVKYTSGKQLLMLFKQNNLVTFSDADLTSLQELLKEYNSLLRKN